MMCFYHIDMSFIVWKYCYPIPRKKFVISNKLALNFHKKEMNASKNFKRLFGFRIKISKFS